MKKEKPEVPVHVIPGRGRKHKTETRIFAREIHENFCTQPGCKFKGQHAQQGVCHTTTTFEGSADWSYVDSLIEAGDKFVQELRRIAKKHYRKDAAYAKYLEDHIACIWANSIGTLDECIRLRRKNALLTKQVEQLKRKKAP